MRETVELMDRLDKRDEIVLKGVVKQTEAGIAYLLITIEEE